MQRSYPFVGGTTTDVEFSNMFKSVFPASVISGLAVSADSSGLNVKVASGSAYVRGHYFTSSATETLAIAPGESQARIDRIVARMDYGSTQSIVLAVKKGTPGAGAPALAQHATNVPYEFLIADVAVAANAVTIPASAVTDRRVLWRDAFKSGIAISMAWAEITGKPSTFPPSSHSHSWSEVTGKPSTFAPSTHTHDDRYYTKSQVDSSLAGKASSSHSHSWSQITSKPSTFPPSGHNHSWSEITGKPSTFSPSTHTHDDRYYTKSQGDARYAYENHSHAWGSITGKPSQFPPTDHRHDILGINSITFGYGANVGGGPGWITSNNLATTAHFFTPGSSAATDGYTVAYINSDGRLARGASSERYKHDIERSPALPDVFAVPLARFVMNDDPDETPRFGHIAEDLAANDATRPFVVFRDGRPESFDMLSLLHAQVEELRRRDVEKDARIRALEARG